MLSIIKKDLFTKKGFAHTEKRLLMIKVIIMLTHTKQSHGKFIRQISAANFYSKKPRQIPTVKKPRQIVAANSHSKKPKQIAGGK